MKKILYVSLLVVPLLFSVSFARQTSFSQKQQTVAAQKQQTTTQKQEIVTTQKQQESSKKQTRTQQSTISSGESVASGGVVISGSSVASGENKEIRETREIKTTKKNTVTSSIIRSMTGKLMTGVANLSGAVSEKISTSSKQASWCVLVGAKKTSYTTKIAYIWKVKTNLAQIVDLAQKVWYNTTVINQYQQQVSVIEQAFVASSCDTSFLDKNRNHLKTLVPLVKKELESLKKFMKK